MVKARLRDTDCVFDVTEENLAKMCKENILSLQSVNENDAPILLQERLKFQDLLKIRPYYAANDKENDPTGNLHEYYIERYDADDYNEENLLRYNHNNVKIFNELVDQKYEEEGSKDTVTESYFQQEWPEFGDPYNSIIYGDDQNTVYHGLCKACGKEKVDTVWRKHYHNKNDGLTH